MLNYEDLKNNFFIIAGPNVIESEQQILFMAQRLKKIFSDNKIQFIFKTSIDKANRTSLSSYRGVSFSDGIEILKKVKALGIPIKKHILARVSQCRYYSYFGTFNVSFT